MTTEWIRRHSLNVRICHWINAVCIVMLVVSGMAILLDYPELYWGKVGYKGHEPALKLADLGITMEGSRQWGRNMHFTFSWIFAINGLIYLAWNLVRGNLVARLWPTRDQRTARHLLVEMRDHLLLRPPRGAAAREYGAWQKISYLFVIFLLLPLLVVTGLAQSPGITAAVPEIMTVFGGKQSARSIHTACTLLVCLFVIVHLFQVFVAGAFNEIRAMVTGRFAVPGKREP